MGVPASASHTRTVASELPVTAIRRPSVAVPTAMARVPIPLPENTRSWRVSVRSLVDRGRKRRPGED